MSYYKTVENTGQMSQKGRKRTFGHVRQAKI